MLGLTKNFMELFKDCLSRRRFLFLIYLNDLPTKALTSLTILFPDELKVVLRALMKPAEVRP